MVTVLLRKNSGDTTAFSTVACHLNLTVQSCEGTGQPTVAGVVTFVPKGSCCGVRTFVVHILFALLVSGCVFCAVLLPCVHNVSLVFLPVGVFFLSAPRFGCILSCDINASFCVRASSYDCVLVLVGTMLRIGLALSGGVFVKSLCF